METLYEQYMAEAYQEALKAYELMEVPIGCVIVAAGEVIGRGHNRRNTDKNPLRHAEITAIDQACKKVGDWRLEGCDIYVTVEPCPMCAGAILQARIDRVIYGAPNKKAGSCGSVINILNQPGFNHQVEIVPEIMLDACAGLMSGFFRNLRNNLKKP